jgi:hypothetical protein
MKRSGFGPRKSSLQRKPWKSSVTDQPDWRAELRAGGIKRSSLKSKPKHVTVADGAKYLAACRGERCFFQIPGVCRLREPDETCVPAHRNEGKGMGLKVPNILTCPACYACHAEFDQGRRFTREEKREMWNRAYAEWEPVRNRKMGITQPEMEAA